MLYFAGYKNGEDLFKREEIESATDQVIWSTDMGAEIALAGRRTRTSAATSSRRCSRTPTGQLGDAARAADERRPHHRHRLGPHDGGGEGRASHDAGAVPQEASTSASAASTRRCSA
ncbi:MAG: hypothetical protein QM736_23610 [Vicinamibacterales bacterium]